MERDEQDEKPCDEPMGDPLWKDCEVRGQRLARAAEDDWEEAGPDFRGKSAQHHASDEHVEAPMGQDADAVEQLVARGGDNAGPKLSSSTRTSYRS